MKFLSLCIVLFLSVGVYAQKFDWKGRIGGSDSDSSASIQIDKSGYVYTSGVFYGEIDLNQDTINKNNFTSKGFSDFYIQKTSPFGEYVWGKQFGGDSIDRITHVKYLDNKLFIAGQFSKSIKLDGVQLNSNGKLDAFLAVLDTSGTVMWAKAYGGSNNDKITSLSVNQSGIYFSGIFTGSILNQEANGSVVFANLKIDGSDLVWSKKIGDLNKVKPYSSSIDAKGNLIFVGSFAGEKIDFNPSTSKDTILSSEKKPNTSFYTQDCFILKLDASGDFIFVKKIGGSTDDDIIFDSYLTKERLAITGQISGSVVFGDSKNSKTIISNGKEDIFVSLYNENGELIWVKNTGGLKTDFGKSIYLDSNLNVYITGTFFDTDGKGVDFDPSTKVFKLNSSTSQHAFVWKLNSLGDYLYAGSFGGSGVDYASYICANDEEEIFTTGQFEKVATFYDKTLVSDGKSDVYLLKSVSEKESGYVIDYALKGFNPDSLPFRLEIAKKDVGNLPWYNKKYILTSVKDTDGEKNTILIDSLQGPVDTTFVPVIKYASKACSDYKIQKKDDWYLPSQEELELMYKNRKKIGGMKDYPYWCSSETDLNNAISIDYTDGKIKQNSNKAERKFVRPVRKKMKNDGLYANNLIQIDLIPNPTKGECLIRLDEKYIQNGVTLEVINSSGQLIKTDKYFLDYLKLDLAELQNGLYFVKLYNQSFTSISKVIKE